MKPTLCVGDVHGNWRRLEALLTKASEERPRDEYEVVQLGDLGHYGYGNSRENDLHAWRFVLNGAIDHVLFGNHDRAVIDPAHHFNGYELPLSATAVVMADMEREGRVHLALERHGYLLTHAGVHPEWDRALGGPSASPEDVASRLHEHAEDRKQSVHAISRWRGGIARAGGILWRDDREPLSACWPQVYGHTRGDIRRLDVHGRHTSYCIDVGSHDNGRLAGIWLPECRVVEVDVEEQAA